MSTLRFELLREALGRKAVSIVNENRPAEDFAKNVFTREKMQRYLSKHTYKTLTDSIDKGMLLNRAIADGVATGMKQWALDMGATHYTHWFQPLTGGSAEKHDAFIEPNPEGGVTRRGKIVRFCRPQSKGPTMPTPGTAPGCRPPLSRRADNGGHSPRRHVDCGIAIPNRKSRRV